VGGCRAVTYRIDDELVHTAQQVGALFDDIQKLVQIVQERDASSGWRARGSSSGSPKQINAFMVKLLRHFANKAPVNHVYHLAVHLDSSLHDKGFQRITERFLQMFKAGVAEASRDIDEYLKIVDNFIGAQRTMIPY
jgi:hypothetical protein